MENLLDIKNKIMSFKDDFLRGEGLQHKIKNVLVFYCHMDFDAGSVRTVIITLPKW